ncbi:hypothetical protein F5Y19DRAFT_448910 [Xylariaceae sp. FL1651]|nr:hypothetical protein F5Y19DRAFT_448910 [Xylariaceae sp. FL1651]
MLCWASSRLMWSSHVNGKRPRVLPQTPAKNPAPSLEGFTNGLCWYLDRPAARRSGFPSWSWAGWKGVVAAYGSYIFTAQKDSL